MDKPHAVLLNFTGNSYHWGCYGTAYEIYQTLLERGYTVETVDVEDTHAIVPTPTFTNDFVDPSFFERFEEQNRRIVRVLRHADVVVVNGEGTLHRGHNGPVNLLYMMFAAKFFLNKPVHLVNHSFYPSGAMEACPLDELYASVAAVLDQVVPRETSSAAVLERLGVGFVQGFDCLPRYIDRHGMLYSASQAERSGILVSGGVCLQDADLEWLGRALARCAERGERIAFTTGAKSDPAPEDAHQFKLLKQWVPSLELQQAQTMRGWLESIAGSRCLVSGRYHHSMAAASLGTPFRALASNTPKIEATMEMLDGPAVISSLDEQRMEELDQFIADALADKAEPVPLASVRKVIALAENNFAGL
jgi:polysaccharide pyruvyl transferase WcaK-like protein